MAGIKVSNIQINDNSIKFTIPKGDVLTKVVGTFKMNKAYTYTIPITFEPRKIGLRTNWFPITKDYELPSGKCPVRDGIQEIKNIRIYAKVEPGRPFGTNAKGHQIYNIVKLGLVALNVNNYIEDFECSDGTLESSMSKLLGENLGNGTGIIKFRESNPASGKTGKSWAANTSATKAITPKPKAIQGMPSNFSSNANNVKILQQYLVRMGEQKNIATTKVPSGIDGIYGRRTDAATKRVMESQKLTWDQLWALAVQYAKQTQGQQSQPQGQTNQELAQVNPEAAEFANPQKLTAHTQGVTQQAQPVSAAQYAANASNVLQPKQAVAESVENKDKETVEEIKNTFYDIFNRMNNATILQ